MSEQQYVIELGSGDRAIVDADDTGWLEEKLRREPGKTFRFLPDDNDTEGHWRGGPHVRVMIDDEDEVEGHALSIHFPTVAEADAFRRRLMLTGVLVGTVAIGTAAGVGLSALQSTDTGSSTGAATVATQAGPMDANEAIVFDAQARADQAYSDRLQAQADAQARGDQAYSDRLTAQAEAQARGDQAWSDRLQGQADAQARGDQAWSDRLQAQADAQAVGPMDAHEAPAFQAQTPSAADDEVEGIGGPIPR